MQIDVVTFCASVVSHPNGFDILGVPSGAGILEVAKTPELSVVIVARPSDADDIPRICRFTITHDDGQLIFGREFAVPPHPRDDTQYCHMHQSTFPTNQFLQTGWHRLELYVDGVQSHSVPLMVYLPDQT